MSGLELIFTRATRTGCSSRQQMALRSHEEESEKRDAQETLLAFYAIYVRWLRWLIMHSFLLARILIL